MSESHLTSLVNSSFTAVPGYELLRNDVAGTVPKHGVCAYIRKDIEIDQIACPTKNVLSFRLANFNVYVVIVYRPPSYTEAENADLVAALEQVTRDKEVMLMGDFNLPSISWPGIGSYAPVGQGSPSERKFLELFNVIGMVQWITQPTFPRSGNTLDLLLTTEIDRVGEVLIEPPLPACDHCPIVFDYVFETLNASGSDEGGTPDKRLWHKGRFSKMNEALLNIDWDFELAYLDCSDSYDRFMSIVTNVTNRFVPTKSKQPEKSGVPWKVSPPAGLIRQRQQAWQRYKGIRLCLGRRSGDALEAYTRFSDLNKQCRNFAVKSQASYEHGLIDSWKENPKLLHRYIRSKKTAAVTVGPLKLPSGRFCSDPKTISECLALSFSSVFCNDTPAKQQPHQVFDGQIPDLQFTVADVQALLGCIDGNSAMGPDEIHPLVLKQCAVTLARPLHVIFQRALNEGSVPKAWKQSTVIPLFKKGTRYDPLNYRPISLSSVVCKTMERLITRHISDYLEEHALLTDHQFGFRSGRLTVDQLLLVYETVSGLVDDGETVDVIYFDYSKAFDIVNHEILLTKLRCIGIDGDILAWISSFLTDRTLQVCVKGHISRPRPVLSDVPQGSVLGPLLFLVYVNHIASLLSCNFKIFADDLKIYAFIDQSKPNAESLVQSDILTLTHTSESWGLKLNANKCAVLRFSRGSRSASATPKDVLNGNLLPVLTSFRDLGVIVDTSLKFHEHVQSLSHKASGLCHNFLKSTVCRTPEFMLFLFKTHIRPLLDYCSCLWNTGFVEDVRKLERVQRRWTKRIDNLGEMGYAERLCKLDLFSVQGRLLRSDLIQYWKVMNAHCSIPVDSMFAQPQNAPTRGHKLKIFVSRAITDVRKRSFARRCVKVWNGLPEWVVTAPDLRTFKKGLVQAIPDRLVEFV